MADKSSGHSPMDESKENEKRTGKDRRKVHTMIDPDKD